MDNWFTIDEIDTNTYIMRVLKKSDSFEKRIGLFSVLAL